jgi:hypothetical protein
MVRKYSICVHFELHQVETTRWSTFLLADAVGHPLNLAFQSISPIATLFIINYFLPPLCLIFYMPLKCYVLHQPIIPNHPSAKFNRNSSESWPGILFSTRNRRTNCNAIHVIKGQACNHVCLVISSFSCFPKIVVVLLSTKDWTPLL